MKKLEIIIRAECLEDLREILEKSGIHGMNITEVMGYGNQKGRLKRYRGTQYRVDYMSKVKVETVVPDEAARPLTEQIVERIQTGSFGDGKIFVYDILDAVRIRTGERGESAL